jgi:hypothetical protein
MMQLIVAEFKKCTQLKKLRKLKEEVNSAYPSEVVGLQVIDYYMWAAQRMFERGEDRFYKMLCSHFKLIMDIDDRRKNKFGQWYSAVFGKETVRCGKDKAHLS